MIGKTTMSVCAAVIMCVLAISLLPVAKSASKLHPVAWSAPADTGLTGAFEKNDALGSAVFIGLGDRNGPEALALVPPNVRNLTDRGSVKTFVQLATGTDDGEILLITVPRDAEDQIEVTTYGNTGGRPLGLQFSSNGDLYVADAKRGLLVSHGGNVFESLCSVPIDDGVPVTFADDVDVASDGLVYFTDATSKFGPADPDAPWHNDLLEASQYEIIEHKGTGRIISCDPRTGTAKVVLNGLVFPNGLVLTHDEDALMFIETGNYAVKKYYLNGPNAGTSVTVIDNLPGFPDNIQRGLDGTYWVGLVSMRSSILDSLSGWPLLRAVSMALPKWMRPPIIPYGHVFAIDESGNVITSMQGDTVKFTVSALETEASIFISSLMGNSIAMAPRRDRAE